MLPVSVTKLLRRGTRRYVSRIPLQAEVDYEKRRIQDPDWKIFGILYEVMRQRSLHNNPPLPLSV